MNILLDTNFIIELVKNKLDFDEVKEYGKICIPRQVLVELEDLSVEGEFKDRKIAELALKIIVKNQEKFRIIELDKRYVDLGIRRFIDKNKGFIVATMDKELKMSLAGRARILNIVNRKKLILL